jgi:adenylosuccinate synthase
MHKISIPQPRNKAFFVVGGQAGSEAKGAAVAWLVQSGSMQFDAYVCNHGAQAGHTAYVNGRKIVTFHLPTGAVVDYLQNGVAKTVFLTAGAVIDPESFFKEIEDYYDPAMVFIHPMAAVITPDCQAASRAPGSASEVRSGVQKGVGQAIARRALRTGVVARDYARFELFVLTHGSAKLLVSDLLNAGKRTLIEIPQGTSLSLSHSGFYPYTTSRDCTIATAMNDANLHPNDYGGSMVVFRTRPIKVGNVTSSDGKQLGYSGPAYPDQQELTWEQLGVTPEITTVSKRIRRVFTFSEIQAAETLRMTRPNVVFISFVNYVTRRELNSILSVVHRHAGAATQIVYQWGPTSEDVGSYEEALEHTREGE